MEGDGCVLGWDSVDFVEVASDGISGGDLWYIRVVWRLLCYDSELRGEHTGGGAVCADGFGQSNEGAGCREEECGAPCMRVRMQVGRLQERMGYVCGMGSLQKAL